MIQRVNPAYRYWEPDVTIHASWRTFEGFRAAMGECLASMRLCRILDRGNYEPGNVFWMTRAEKNLNRQNNYALLKWSGSHHGHSVKSSATYRSWANMLQRALNRNGKNPTYADVDVCPRWRESFENFLADMGPRPEGTTLGRFGDVGNYEPGNCAWQTRREQNEAKILKRADLAMAA
jgi:hypothetical protein